MNCIYDVIGSETDFDAISEKGVVARLFTPTGVKVWDAFGEGLLSDGGFKEEVDQLLVPRSTPDSKSLYQEAKRPTQEILVCTHGSRDCRCSNLGGALVQTLRSEISKRNLEVNVREIAHVGGHK